MSKRTSTFSNAAYGGDGWSPRRQSMGGELGSVWADCGIDTEWRPLLSVVLHRPGLELEASSEPDAVLMLEAVDVSKAQAEHDAMAEAYRGAGVEVIYVEPGAEPRPNQMFCADLMFATPEGVILARPASSVRAGEEREVARCLSNLGVPIVRSVSGRGTFEGADAAWLDPATVVIGRGLRTNEAGIEQVSQTLAGIDVDSHTVDLPFGTMHLMGMLRIVDANLAVAWPRRTPYALVVGLHERGYDVIFLPEGDEHEMNRAMNVVVLGPRRVLMNGGRDRYQDFYESHDIECVTVVATELVKAAGGFGCLTGVVRRERS